VFAHIRWTDRNLPPSFEPLYATTLPTAKRNNFFMNILCIELFFPQKHKKTLLFGSTLKYGRHFDHLTQPVNMRMRVCYPDSHEAGLCCYLVIHVEKLLYILQLFHFHLWPVYWLSLVVRGFVSFRTTFPKNVSLFPDAEINALFCLLRVVVTSRSRHAYELHFMPTNPSTLCSKLDALLQSNRKGFN
jgi:hypothetical protein